MKKTMKVMVLGIMFAVSAGAAVITAPFTDSFTEDPRNNPDYTVYTNATCVMTHDAVNGLVNYYGNGGNGDFRFFTEVSNLGGENTQDFSASMVVNYDNFNDYMRLVVLGTTNNSTAFGYAGYFRGKDNVHIYRDGVSVATGTWTYGSVGTNVTLLMTGEYNEEGTALTMTFTVSDVSGNSMILSYVDNTPLTGQYVGFGGRAVTGSNFKVLELNVIPEPVTVSLFGLAGLVVLGLRKMHAR